MKTIDADNNIFTEDTEYKRELGLLESTSIVIGRIIGSGIFRTPGPIMAAVACTSLFGAVWLFGGIITVFGAVCYAELVAMMPKSGGPYVYLKAAYPPVWSFLRGWAMFFVSETASIVAVALVFAEYSSEVCKIFYGTPLNYAVIVIIALGIIWLLTTINLFGVYTSGIFQNIFSIIKIIAIIIIITVSFGSAGDAGNFTIPLWPEKFSWETVVGIVAALRLAFFAYSGWEGATYIAEEVKNPRRNLPLSLFLGIGGVMLLYFATNASYIYQLPVGAISQSRGIAADAMKVAIGALGGILISFAVMISTFGNVSTQILCKARTWQAMARDGLFFRVLAPLHPRHRTPNNSLIAQALWASVLLLFAAAAKGFSTSDKTLYESFIDFFFATGCIFNIMTFFSVFVLRRKYPELTRPYRAWLYPLSMIIIIIVYLALFIITVVSELIPSMLGIALTSTGFIYYYWKIRQRYSKHNEG